MKCSSGAVLRQAAGKGWAITPLIRPLPQRSVVLRQLIQYFKHGGALVELCF
jgi:hypothetical protein